MYACVLQKVLTLVLRCRLAHHARAMVWPGVLPATHVPRVFNQCERKQRKERIPNLKRQLKMQEFMNIPYLMVKIKFTVLKLAV